MKGSHIHGVSIINERGNYQSGLTKKIYKYIGVQLFLVKTNTIKFAPHKNTQPFVNIFPTSHWLIVSPKLMKHSCKSLIFASFVLFVWLKKWPLLVESSNNLLEWWRENHTKLVARILMPKTHQQYQSTNYTQKKHTNPTNVRSFSSSKDTVWWPMGILFKARARHRKVSFPAKLINKKFISTHKAKG